MSRKIVLFHPNWVFFFLFYQLVPRVTTFSILTPSIRKQRDYEFRCGPITIYYLFIPFFISVLNSKLGGFCNILLLEVLLEILLLNNEGEISLFLHHPWNIAKKSEWQICQCDLLEFHCSKRSTLCYKWKGRRRNINSVCKILMFCFIAFSAISFKSNLLLFSLLICIPYRYCDQMRSERGN